MKTDMNKVAQCMSNSSNLNSPEVSRPIIHELEILSKNIKILKENFNELNTRLEVVSLCRSEGSDEKDVPCEEHSSIAMTIKHQSDEIQTLSSQVRVQLTELEL